MAAVATLVGEALLLVLLLLLWLVLLFLATQSDVVLCCCVYLCCLVRVGKLIACVCECVHTYTDKGRRGERWGNGTKLLQLPGRTRLDDDVVDGANERKQSQSHTPREARQRNIVRETMRAYFQGTASSGGMMIVRGNKKKQSTAVLHAVRALCELVSECTTQTVDRQAGSVRKASDEPSESAAHICTESHRSTAPLPPVRGPTTTDHTRWDSGMWRRQTAAYAVHRRVRGGGRSPALDDC